MTANTIVQCLRVLALVSITSLAQAFPQDRVSHDRAGGVFSRDGTSCPAIWTTIASDLRRDFSGCNQLATSAIRFAFHDAAGYSVKNTPYGPASGGADGSLLLSDNEIGRPAEAPMQIFRPYLLNKFHSYQGISAADFVQFAGSIGVTSCPGGPVYQTVVGREDDSTAAPDGNLPAAFGPGAAYDVLIQLWADKGFSPRELAALIGAHTVAHSFAQLSNGVPLGAPQDSTPAKWDTTYYSQTQAKYAPPGVSRFQSDVNLSNATTACGQAFTEFAGNKDAWATAFTAAMYKLSVAGISQDKIAGFTDCTSVVQLNAV